MKKLYKITEVASLFNISRQTLIYYDRIGLFTPDFIQEENSYRYYRESQFFELEFILLMKEAGFTLKEIQKYIQKETPEESLLYLEEKEAEVVQRIELLKKTRATLKRKIKELKNITTGSDKPAILILKPQRILTLPLKSPFSYLDFASVLSSLGELKEKYSIQGDEFIEFLRINRDNPGSYTDLTSLGIKIPSEIPPVQGEVNLQGGTYAHITHRDSWDNIGTTYRVLLDYIDDIGYVPDGEALEEFNDVIVHLGRTGGGTTVRIYLPVKKSSPQLEKPSA